MESHRRRIDFHVFDSIGPRCAAQPCTALEMRDRIAVGAGSGMGASDREEAMSLISNVCALAKALEKNLPTLAAHPRLLRSSLEVIAGTSNKAMKLLPFNHHPPPPAGQRPSSSYSTHMAFAPDHEDSSPGIMGAYDFHMLLQQKEGVEAGGGGGGGGVELAMGSNVIGRRDFGIQFSPEALALSGSASHERLGTDTPASSVAGEALQGAECSKKR
ncbi:hypothetical protein ACLOJK_012236 [Asimina triloba]